MKVYDRNGLQKVSQTIVPTRFNRGAQWVNQTGPVVVPTNTIDRVIPYTCTLKSVLLLTDGGPGNCIVDVWASAFSLFPPTAANDITGGNPPTITAGITLLNSTLAGWLTSFNANDVIRLRLRSALIFTRVDIELEFQ